MEDTPVNFDKPFVLPTFSEFYTGVGLLSIAEIKMSEIVGDEVLDEALVVFDTADSIIMPPEERTKWPIGMLRIYTKSAVHAIASGLSFRDIRPNTDSVGLFEHTFMGFQELNALALGEQGSHYYLAGHLFLVSEEPQLTVVSAMGQYDQDVTADDFVHSIPMELLNGYDKRKVLEYYGAYRYQDELEGEEAKAIAVPNRYHNWVFLNATVLARMLTSKRAAAAVAEPQQAATEMSPELQAALAAEQARQDAEKQAAE